MEIAHQDRGGDSFDRRNRAASPASGRTLKSVAQVVPDLPTFAVDDGFAYSIPEGMEVKVGSIVRVPLGGRRVRGWVTAIRSEAREGLKEIIGVSGAHPVFSDELLQTLRWAAVHYVSPLAALIPKAAPPNLPKRGAVKLPDLRAAAEVSNSTRGIAGQLAAGGRTPATFIAGSGSWSDVIVPLAAAAAASDRGSLIVVPTAHECADLAGELRAAFGRRVVSTTSSAPAAERTKAWSQAKGSPGTIVVGTPEIALWPIADPGLAVVIEAGRRAMKSRQTPTVHVRELLRRRSVVERFGLVLMGQVPTLETASGSVSLVDFSPGRVWPLVEVIDRNAEPPSGSLLAEATRAAVAGAARRGEPVFVFVSRRGYSPAARCTSCGELRRCAQCGSSPGQGTQCERCGAANVPCVHCGGASFAPVGAAAGRVLEDLRRTFGDSAGPAGSGAILQVGTERDIPRSGSVGLSVVVDADSMLLRPHYRAEEDTLRILARVAATVRRGRGHRCVVQTRMQDHRVLRAMRHGNGTDVVADWLAERDAEQLPPFGELMALEITEGPATIDGELRDLAGNEIAVFGPGESGDRSRWLIQAPDLRQLKIRLRPKVQNWRDKKIRVRVDADPLDV